MASDPVRRRRCGDTEVQHKGGARPRGPGGKAGTAGAACGRSGASAAVEPGASSSPASGSGSGSGSPPSSRRRAWGGGGVAAKSTAAAAAASTVRDLRAELYRGLGGAAACVRLLHRGGAAGCAADGPAGRAEGRLRAYAPGLDLSAAAGPTVVVARAGPELAALLARAADGEPGLAGLAGVLVEPRGDPGAVGWSPEDAAPQAAFAPYGAYAWNPSGTGLLQRALDVPVFLLAAEDAEAVAGWSAANERGAHRGAEYVAAAQLTMYAAGSPDSPACLREGRCLPLGGYSTYAVVAAADEAGPAAAGKPALLVTAQMDGTALFHDAIGNGFALSGLLAMLAAFKECARLLQGAGTEAAVDLVFVAFAGESWGYMGSRAFARGVQQDGRAGNLELPADRIAGVLELGSVAAGAAAGGPVFLHACGAAREAAAGLPAALKAAGRTRGLDVRDASGTPEAPPSSCLGLGSAGLPGGVVVEDFNERFATDLYHGFLDRGAGMDLDRVADVAATVAAAALAVAVPGRAPELDGAAVGATVRELHPCLVAAEPGFQCPAVQALINTDVARPDYYVGVLHTTDESRLMEPDGKSALALFLYSWMASHNALPGSSGRACDADAPCGEGEACVGWRPKQGAAGRGRCLQASAGYLPAWPPQLSRDAKTLRWTVEAGQDDPRDPLWVESDWPWGTPNLEVYLKGGGDVGVFFAGLCTFLLAVGTGKAVELAYAKRR